MRARRIRLALAVMVEIESISTGLGTTSWIWGGIAVDVHVGRLLREHDDLEYLCLNLHGLWSAFASAAECRGWRAVLLKNQDLRLTVDGFRVHLGHVEMSERARWTHNGDKGSIFFPTAWLTAESVDFYGTPVHVVAPEFDYVHKWNPQMLNPEWVPREKDLRARTELRKILVGRGIDPDRMSELVNADEV